MLGGVRQPQADPSAGRVSWRHRTGRRRKRKKSYYKGFLSPVKHAEGLTTADKANRRQDT